MIEDQHIDPLAAGLRALLPPGYAKTVGFLIPARAMTQQLIDWYENEHSVYASFMWPHMRRYQRNYIVDVRRGPSPLYKVISEFCWKDEEQKRMIISHFSTEVAARTLNEVLPEFVIVPFPEGGYFLAPVDERQVATGKRVLRHDEPRRRKIILLRRRMGRQMQRRHQPGEAGADNDHRFVEIGEKTGSKMGQGSALRFPACARRQGGHAPPPPGRW